MEVAEMDQQFKDYKPPQQEAGGSKNPSPEIMEERKMSDSKGSQMKQPQAIFSDQKFPTSSALKQQTFGTYDGVQSTISCKVAGKHPRYQNLPSVQEAKQQSVLASKIKP